MFSRKFVLTNCLAIATSMLAGCASYKNESGLPKWLDDASEANRLGYFMGLSLKDSPAPEGFDPSKNTLMSDLTFSTLAHSNALPGTDIGSFSLEPVSYTHLTLPTTVALCRSRWSPYH